MTSLVGWAGSGREAGAVQERRRPARVHGGKRAVLAVPRPATNGALGLARVAILVTVIGWAAFVVATLDRVFRAGLGVHNAFDAALYLTVVTLLAGSALAYLVARLGFLYRTRLHDRVPRAVIDAFFDVADPSVTVLVPSYREEPNVIGQTLLSAALQEYPGLRVVLLLDDPPNPDDEENRRLLEAARSLSEEIEQLFRGPSQRFADAYESFAARMPEGAVAGAAELVELADCYAEAASYLGSMCDYVERGGGLSADFVSDEIVRGLARDFSTVSSALLQASLEQAEVSSQRLLQLYRRLAWTFSVEISCFERKQYASLSHEPNKAMNLNSYIALMGGSYVEEETLRGQLLSPAHPEVATFHVPDPDYVLTLDADSVLLPEYCLRLVYLLEQPEFERVAIAQTPYSAFPAASSRIERIAGATTDVQHIVHQGLSHYGAAFWVGANAVLRKRALDEIGVSEREGGRIVRRYIQDRTPIEDTESTVDLVLRGWSLYNYPERLSYSATPPDFGSLCVQRQRWANGGLVILRKLRRYAASRGGRGSGSGKALTELFLRTNYLVSIAWSSLGLIVLLAYPLNAALLTPIALATALPYFAAMAGDLKRCGYKRSDALRIYAFNLLLLPVNTAGTLKSIGQAISGQKIAFARTPKVRSRTTAPITFVLVPYVIISFSLLTVWLDIRRHHYPHAAYAAVNAVLCAYALVAYIGIGNSIVDVWVNALQYVTKPKGDDGAHAAAPLDWATVLYAGANHGSHGVPVPSSRLVAASPQPALPAPAAVTHVAAEANGDRMELTHFLTSFLGDALERGRVVAHVDGRAIELRRSQPHRQQEVPDAAA